MVGYSRVKAPRPKGSVPLIDRSMTHWLTNLLLSGTDPFRRELDATGAAARCFYLKMLPFYSYTFIVLVVFAVFFYRAGEFEGSSGLVWAGLSILISVAIWRWLHGGVIAVLLGQLGLFAGITLYRSHKKP